MTTSWCDDDGLDLPSLETAMGEALRGARALAAEQALHGRLNLSHRIDVADESGATVGTGTFREAVRIEGQPAPAAGLAHPTPALPIVLVRQRPISSRSSRRRRREGPPCPQSIRDRPPESATGPRKGRIRDGIVAHPPARDG